MKKARQLSSDTYRLRARISISRTNHPDLAAYMEGILSLRRSALLDHLIVLGFSATYQPALTATHQLIPVVPGPVPQSTVNRSTAKAKASLPAIGTFQIRARISISRTNHPDLVAYLEGVPSSRRAATIDHLIVLGFAAAHRPHTAAIRLGGSADFAEVTPAVPHRNSERAAASRADPVARAKARYGDALKDRGIFGMGIDEQAAEF